MLSFRCTVAGPAHARRLEAYALLDAEQYSSQIALAEQQTFRTVAGRPDWDLPIIDDDGDYTAMGDMADQLDAPED